MIVLYRSRSSCFEYRINVQPGAALHFEQKHPKYARTSMQVAGSQNAIEHFQTEADMPLPFV